MVIPIICASLSIISVSIYLYEKIKAYTVKSVIIKIICSLLFITSGIYFLSNRNGHILPIFILPGLISGMLGDIFLDLKYVHPEHNKEYTYAGFIAFGVAHILNITGLFLEFFDVSMNTLFVILPFVFGVIMGLITIFIEKPMQLSYKSYKLIVFIYGLFLFSDVGVSFSLYASSGFTNNTLLMIFIGEALFAISDLVLSSTYFGENHEKPIDLITNISLYYIAQNLIVLSLLFLI